MDGVSDLVSDSKIDVQFYDDHFRHEVFEVDSSGPGGPHRRRKREQRWTREKRLGRGSFGDVWLYRCEEDGESKLQAIKEIPRLSYLAKTIDYKRELEAIFKFSHRKYEGLFVESFGWFENLHSVFVVMEYIELGDLEQHLEQPLAEVEAQQISSQLLEGLDHIHENGFAHRDLKPANIFVVQKSPHWWVKIGDFGVSKRTREGDSTFKTLAGTPGFCAPEVNMTLGRDIIEYTQLVDIWSFGIMLHYVLTGSMPFSEHIHLKKYIRNSQFPTTALSTRGVSPDCQDFIQALVVVDPTARLSARDALKHAWLQSLSQHSNLHTRGVDTASLKDSGQQSEESLSLTSSSQKNSNDSTVEESSSNTQEEQNNKKPNTKKTPSAENDYAYLFSRGEVAFDRMWYSKAERIFRDVYTKRKATLGINHLITLNSTHWLGVSIFKQSRTDEEAEQMFREAYEGRKARLGTLHKDTLWSLYYIGKCLLSQELYKEAQDPLWKAYKGLEKILGSSNLMTLYCVESLGSCLERLGKYEDATKLLLKYYEEHKDTDINGAIQLDYSDVAEIADVLASSLKQLKRYNEAANIYRELAEYYTLTKNDSWKLMTRHELASCLLGEGRFKEAEVVFLEVHEQEEADYGSDDSDACDSAHGLGESFHGQGELKKAKKMFRKAYEHRRHTLGDEHELTRESWRRMNEAGSGLQKFLNRLQYRSKKT